MQIRSCRPRLHRGASALQHGGAALPVPHRDTARDRHRQGERGMNAIVKQLTGLRDWVDDRFPPDEALE